MVSLLQGFRSENMYPDVQKCRQDAEALYKGGQGRLGTDEATFIKIFGTRSNAEIKCIAEQYASVSQGTPLIKAIESEFSGSAKKTLKAIVSCMIDPHEYFAKRVNESIKGLGNIFNINV
ncbi:MAG: annexin [archaeon]|nr:annexin [archaeon]